MDILEALNKLNACHGPSGDESGVADVLEAMARPYVDECRRDPMGNLIAHRKGSGPRVMFAAHMDTVGFIVTHIEENGALRFGKLGGLHPEDCLHAPVRFKNGTRGTVAADEDAEQKDLTLGDLSIQIGAKDRAEAEKMVSIGDTAVYDLPAFQNGDMLFSPYLDDRISCVAMLQVLEGLGKAKNDLYFVFTAQEELGMRGAKTAAWSIEPDYCIALDVTGADGKEGSSKTLGGAAIKVKDRSVICSTKVVQTLTQLAQKKKIPFQMDVLTGGGTDAGAVLTSRGGVLTGGISVPCRWAHAMMSTAAPADVEACTALALAFAQAELPALK